MLLCKPFALCDEDSADCAGEKVRIGDEAASAPADKFGFKDLRDCPHDACICGDAAGKDDWFDELPAAAEIAFQIPGKGQAKPREDIAHRRCLLLEVNHIAFCEDGASARHSRDVFALQRQSAEFLFDIYTQTVRLLVEK